MSLFSRITDYLKQNKKPTELKDLYEKFSDVKPSTVRGRINEQVGKKIIRTSRGQYLLAGIEIEALVEQEDSRLAVPNILKANIFYDLVFFDIPYSCNGQKGGNRNIVTYDTIDPGEFQDIITQIEKTLRDEDSQIYFMISGGKTSAHQANKYIRCFEDTNLKLASEGSYTKLTKNGKQCNMGKYPLPAEKIMVYSPSGKLLKPEETILDFALERPPLPRGGGYPTQKPLELLEQIVKQATTSTRKNVLDLFSGSGVTLEACLKLNRFIHAFDVADDSIKRMKNILEKYLKKGIVVPELMNNFNYRAEDLKNFANGRLFA